MTFCYIFDQKESPKKPNQQKSTPWHKTEPRQKTNIPKQMGTTVPQKTLNNQGALSLGPPRATSTYGKCSFSIRKQHPTQQLGWRRLDVATKTRHICFFENTTQQIGAFVEFLQRNGDKKSVGSHSWKNHQLIPKVFPHLGSNFSGRISSPKMWNSTFMIYIYMISQIEFLYAKKINSCFT